MKHKDLIRHLQGASVPYSFCHWGPFLWKTNIDSEVIKFLLKESEGLTENFDKKLAGDLSRSMLYSNQSHKRVWDILRIYIDDYFKAFKSEWNCKPGLKWNPLNVWINYQRAHDHNPYHMHSGQFSFVIYCSVPKILQEEIKQLTTRTNHPAPGGISFFYGDPPLNMGIGAYDFVPTEGMMLVFPAYLRHMVYPFRSKCTRISVSGNLEVHNNEYEQVIKHNYD